MSLKASSGFGLILGAAASLLTWAQPASGQGWPPEIKNLQVLSSDTPVGEVIGHMRAYAMALGVRCQHCHVGEEGQPIQSFDFASDEKPAKQTARTMLKMTQSINADHVGTLGIDNAVQVRCVTCHRGTTRPEQLSTLLESTATTEGIDAALAKYQELRDEYHGSATYDFSEISLIQAGEALIAQERVDDAIKLLELNLEHHPTSQWTASTLVGAYEQLGRKADAIALLKRLLEDNPDNPRIKQQLERLEG